MRRPFAARAGFEEFAAAQGPGLARVAYAMCGDRGRAEDAAQEALARVYQRWSRLDDPLAYARQVAVNATRDEWRRARREIEAHRQASRVPPPGEDPQERLLERSALRVALERLTHGQRAVIVLRYGCQLSEAETAATLNITTGTVKSQTARALARLRTVLAPELVAHDTRRTDEPDRR